jgi:urease accessory protein
MNRIISQKIGHLSDVNFQGKSVDYVDFEWFETKKRIVHKTSQNGVSLRIKFLNENPDFKQGDVLFEMPDTIVAVNILPCECIVMLPRNHQELAALCYEIGNHHIPLFMDENELVVAFEKPMFQYLTAIGYQVKIEERKLLNALKTTVAPHGDNKSLFTKIMQLTQTS